MASKQTPYGIMPTPLEALRALVAEFDRYSEQMTRIGRGHGDYGAERAIAHMVLADADVETFNPDDHSIRCTAEQCDCEGRS